VENDRKFAAAIEKLAAEWEAPVTVVARDVFAALPSLGAFDLVYADPPYDFGRYDELVEALRGMGGVAAVEHRRGMEIPGRTRDYGDVSITFLDQR
jgi:16S rRNA G966 N2-methylase RsmD